MVIQQSNMAMMLLGKVPHPETGQTMRDIEAARMFIDQLEMLEAKTKGNLTKEEEQLLKQSLMSLAHGVRGGGRIAGTGGQEAGSGSAGGEHKIEAPARPAADEESKKKFTKKY